MGNDTVLTDAEIGAIVCRLYEKTGAKEIGELEINAHLIPIGRAIEQAVLQSPEVQRLRNALEDVSQWMDSQADAQSKGGHATFDIMMLREKRDIARSALAAMEKQP